MRFDRPTFVSLLVGHLAFLVLSVAVSPVGGYIVTPAYVLPMLVVRRRSGSLLREVIVFAVLMTGVHYLAIIEAINIVAPFSGSSAPANDWLAGGAGSLIGSSASFALVALFRLAKFDRRTLAIMALGTVLLTAFGAVGVAAGLYAGADADGLLFNLIVCLCIYTPWQVAFAAILAAILRPARVAIEVAAHG